MAKVILSGCLIYNNKKELLFLYRPDHKHYETPGGKIESKNCKDIKKPTINELANEATRELFEELGDGMQFEDLEYFGKVEFIIPDGRKGVAHKFVTKIVRGEPRINEPKKFSKLNWLSIGDLDNYPLSPDLKRLVSKIKKKFL